MLIVRDHANTLAVVAPMNSIEAQEAKDQATLHSINVCPGICADVGASGFSVFGLMICDAAAPDALVSREQCADSETVTIDIRPRATRSGAYNPHPAFEVSRTKHGELARVVTRFPLGGLTKQE